MALYPIKVLLDKKRIPFIPFITVDSILVDNDNTTLEDLLNNMYTMDEINAMLEDELSKFDVYPSEDELPETARDGNVAIVEDGENYFMYFYFDGKWYKLTQKGDTGAVGPQGPTGNSGVYRGPNEPTDPEVGVWIDTSDGTTIAIAEEASF